MKAPTFDLNSLSFISKARKFLNSKNSSSGKRDFEGISFSNEVYQETCRPVKNSEESSTWRHALTILQRTNTRQSLSSPRTSIRSYRYPWGRKDDGEVMKKEESETTSETRTDEGIFTVELIKPHYGYLGLVLVGGADTPLQKHYVKDILPDSIAAKSGSVRIGDELIEVNGHTLRGRTHSSALVVIRSLPPVIKILIERSKDKNRRILSSFASETSPEDPGSSDSGDPNITSPKERSRKRSIIEMANASSIINKSVCTVIDVTRSISIPMVKPAKLVRRESKCLSFIGVANGDRDDDAKSCKGEVVKDEGPDEEASDNDDRLSILSNTSEWCARQLLTSSSSRDSTVRNDDTSDVMSTFSMSTLSESLPGPFAEETIDRQEEYVPSQSTPLRQGSIRETRLLTESIIEVDSDEDEERVPSEPTMFLRRGSLRARGSLALKRVSCIEREEERATWPISTIRQRSSLNWDTFVPPPEKPVRRSSSACIRPSSMYTNNVPSNRFKGKNPDSTKHCSRSLQRSNSTGKYIDKQTLRTKVYREPNTGSWGFSIAGGICSPYGDLPIHVLDIESSATARGSLRGSLLKKGDEIVSFGGENFENITFLEANRKMKNFEENSTTVILKRKYLHRKKAQPCGTFAEAWNEQAKQGKRTRQRPDSFYY